MVCSNTQTVVNTYKQLIFFIYIYLYKFENDLRFNVVLASNMQWSNAVIIFAINLKKKTKKNYQSKKWNS